MTEMAIGNAATTVNMAEGIAAAHGQDPGPVQEMERRLQGEAAARWRCEETNRIKTLFIANMSHEFRTPNGIADPAFETSWWLFYGHRTDDAVPHNWGRGIVAETSRYDLGMDRSV